MTKEATIFVTLGHGIEFGLSDESMFIRTTVKDSSNYAPILDLGPPTKENFNQLISNMKRLECHLEDETYEPTNNYGTPF